MQAVIATEDLRKSFRGRKGSVEAVQGVSFEMGRGEIFGFLGPNGAGKTTTLRMLTTMLPIDSGSASVAGFDVAHQPKQVRWTFSLSESLNSLDASLTERRTRRRGNDACDYGVVGL